MIGDGFGVDGVVPPKTGEVSRNVDSSVKTPFRRLDTMGGHFTMEQTAARATDVTIMIHQLDHFSSRSGFYGRVKYCDPAHSTDLATVIPLWYSFVSSRASTFTSVFVWIPMIRLRTRLDVLKGPSFNVT